MWGEDCAGAQEISTVRSEESCTVGSSDGSAKAPVCVYVCDWGQACDFIRLSRLMIILLCVK